VVPDLIAFGKKAQVCGVMAGPRLDEVRDNCFRLPSRINSTWGGSLADMVRSRFCLEVIERDKLVANAALRGEELLEGLHEIAAEEPIISAVRGRGLLVAFDLPDKSMREQFYRGLYDRGLLAIRCGDRSIRFRPALDLSPETVEAALEIIRAECRSISRSAGPAVANKGNILSAKSVS